MCSAWLRLSSLQVFGRPSQQPSLLTICTAPLASSQLGGLWGEGKGRLHPVPYQSRRETQPAKAHRTGEGRPANVQGAHRGTHTKTQGQSVGRAAGKPVSLSPCVPSGFHDKRETDQAASSSIIRAN